MSGIAVDPGNANHAYISFCGLQRVRDRARHRDWSRVRGHLQPGDPHGDVEQPRLQPRRSADYRHRASTANTGDLFVSTDFGVNMLRASNTQWVPAAGSLPPVAVYGLTIDSNARVLYAATHGRGAWKLDLR